MSNHFLHPRSEPIETSTAAWAETHSVKHSISFAWSISDFSSHCFTNTEELPHITSPSFGPTTEPNLQFYIRLYPRGKSPADKDHISMSFFLRSCPAENLLK